MTVQRKAISADNWKAALRRLKAKPECRAIFTSYAPDNHVAARLYASLGFKDLHRVGRRSRTG